MHAATAIADEFLDEDKLIVYTQGNNSKREDFICKKPGLFEKGELIVLIDETSASASEVLAGALQDWDRATILGRRSFGKGLVQQQFNLSDGGALRLTVARYYTPLGRNIQKPYEKKHFDAYEDDIYKRFESGELSNADTINANGKAYKTLKGKLVYEGGGITPDVFIGLDTLKYKSIKQQYKLGSSLYTYAYYHYIANKAAFAQVKNIDDIKKIVTTQSINWLKLQALATKDSINYNFNSEQNKQLITLKVQAFLARQVLDASSFFKIMNTTDDMVLKALERLK
jgi:carboxyl-terminal processing protease